MGIVAVLLAIFPETHREEKRAAVIAEVAAMAFHSSSIAVMGAGYGQTSGILKR